MVIHIRYIFSSCSRPNSLGYSYFYRLKLSEDSLSNRFRPLQQNKWGSQRMPPKTHLRVQPLHHAVALRVADITS